MASAATQFHVTGMKCNGCVTKVREAIAKLSGVSGVEVDLQNARAVVQGQVDTQAVIRAVKDAGYSASLTYS